MKWLRGLRVPFIILGLLISGIMAAVSYNPRWIKIESVDLELPDSSHQDLLFQRIRTSLAPQMQNYAGLFFWQVPLNQVYELVSRDKRVRKAAVYREFPNRIRVEIEPYQPLLAYLSSDNRFYPVAQDATLLPALSAAEVSDLPIIRGEELKDEQRLRATTIELYEAIPSEGSFRKNAVSEILYQRKEGFKVFLSGGSGGGGGEIKMGDADFGPKISRVEKVLSYLESQGVKGRVIDARFSKKVVVRVRNNP